MLDKQSNTNEGYKTVRQIIRRRHDSYGSMLSGTLYDKIRNKFRKYSNDQENHVKDVQKSLEAIAVVECMLFTKDILRKVVMMLHLS